MSSQRGLTWRGEDSIVTWRGYHESDYRDLFTKSLASDVNTAPRLTSLAPGALLVLPQSFGNIYLGETFSSYVCVHNDSTEVCSSVSVRSDTISGSN